MSQESDDYEKGRIARWRRNDKMAIAKMFMRDAICHERERLKNSEEPIDFTALACEACEAAEALLVALDDKPVDFPEYKA